MEYIIIFLKIIVIYFLFFILNYLNNKKIVDYNFIDFLELNLVVLVSFYTIVNLDFSLFKGVVIIIIILLLNFFIKYFSLINPKVRYYLDNRFILVVNNGKLNFKEVIKNRFILDELLINIKLNNIKGINDIDKAYLNNDNLIVFTKKD